MKKIQWFILIGVGFLIGAIVATAVVWYYVVIKPLHTAVERVDVADLAEQVEQRAVEAVDQSEQLVDEVTAAIAPPTDAQMESVTATSVEPVTITTDQLPESQQQILTTFGLGEAEYVITIAMQQCAEAKLGKERLDEIVGGATPGVLEAASLLSCLSQ